MTFQEILGYLKDGLALVQKLPPVAVQLGIPNASQAATIAGELVDIGQNLADRIEDGTVAANSDDQAELSALLAKLRALNDAEDAEALGN